MDEHPNVQLMRDLDEKVTASGDMAAAFEALADDVEWHEIGGTAPTVGRQALGERFGAADYEVTTETHDIVGNDEHVVQLLTNTATRNGKTLTYRTAEIYHVKDGKIAARWAFSDDTSRIVDFFS